MLVELVSSWSSCILDKWLSPGVDEILTTAGKQAGTDLKDVSWTRSTGVILTPQFFELMSI